MPVPGRPLRPAADALNEPTQLLPTVPLLTRAGQWRANGGRHWRNHPGRSVR